MQTSKNNLDFSLCAALSICYSVVALEIEQGPKEVSSDKYCVTKKYYG